MTENYRHVLVDAEHTALCDELRDILNEIRAATMRQGAYIPTTMLDAAHSVLNQIQNTENLAP